jgi:cellulose synthase (UDP-forming)
MIEQVGEGRQSITEKAELALFVFVLAGLLFFSGLRVDFATQMVITVVVLIGLIVIRSQENAGFVRVLFVTLSSFIVLRYLLWRLNYTLVYEDFFSYIGAIALFLAELYGCLMFFFSVFVNICPLQRKPPALPVNQSLWPSVDVIIPCYNEPFELVKITMAAARNLDYPAQKLRIYLLDDGGTQQKLNAPDQQARNEAYLRSQLLKAFCKQLDITYLTRAHNINAKAGNMNHALQFIHGELILVLDADHAPAVDFLHKTAGFFLQDEKLFLVQTPHFFINPDPFEKNLDLFGRMPAENDMFYKAIQPGLDFWQGSFFCGSAAILKRQAIDEVNGFSGKTITEDSETAIKLHSKGWKSQYLMYPLISGLQPETFDSFMIQRMRWAQGMVQNFIFNNPVLIPNLKISQRICYLSNMMFWFFPFARLIFLVSPGFYLFFGLKIYHANITEFFTYTVPFLAVLLLVNHYFFSKVRWVFVSEIYETMQSLFSIRAVLAVLKNPNKPQFSVTPKMEKLDQDFISPLSKPFYWTIVYTVMAVVFGFWRYMSFSAERPLIAITLFWGLFNLLLILAALGALYEHRQRRVNPRIPVQMAANWLIKSKLSQHRSQAAVQVKDLSMGGSNFISSFELPMPDDDEQAFLEIVDEQSQIRELFQVVVNNQSHKHNHFAYGVQFQYANLDDYLRIVRFIHGNSARWVKIHEQTGKDPGLIRSVVFMIKNGVYYGFTHLYVVLKSFLTKIKNVYA